ncbi:hypothetical protein QPX96_07860 [Limosilactobacillus fermentum]|nr:hypothetical protein [Limosilactobacillus fermentum]
MDLLSSPAMGFFFLGDHGKDPSAAQFILEMLHDWSMTDLLANNRQPMPVEEATRYQRAITRVASSEPAQYVVGKAPFLGGSLWLTGTS